MGTQTSRIRLAVTTGDPFGIGPEVTAAAVRNLDVAADVTVFGADDLPGARCVGIPVAGPGPDPAGPSAAGGQASLEALRQALAACRKGEFDALVTAPISKESWALADGPTDGHTPHLGRFFGVESPLMVFTWDQDEPVVALLTHHIPLRAVASTLTSARVEAAVRRLHAGLIRDFGRPDPAIGVCGLNPHAGEHGLLGTEEADFIEPALERLSADGIRALGPIPGDTAFAWRDRYDAILALYHDQGLAPVKALAFRTAVNVTLGLPIVRTSPAHGTAFEIAGTGRADPTSMGQALAWAIRLAAQRAR
ncbi:MAG: 4-hydroxythreonine-4-phosphate dehydrogenase PdxA [Planctomycetota bacterium]|nr:4-hydroxythreonine-4-phosphate dehydrogenase PdxA [Planctomycetota bacterium]